MTFYHYDDCHVYKTLKGVLSRDVIHLFIFCYDDDADDVTIFFFTTTYFANKIIVTIFKIIGKII